MFFREGSMRGDSDTDAEDERRDGVEDMIKLQ